MWRFGQLRSQCAECRRHATLNFPPLSRGNAELPRHVKFASKHQQNRPLSQFWHARELVQVLILYSKMFPEVSAFILLVNWLFFENLNCLHRNFLIFFRKVTRLSASTINQKKIKSAPPRGNFIFASYQRIVAIVPGVREKHYSYRQRHRSLRTPRRQRRSPAHMPHEIQRRLSPGTEQYPWKVWWHRWINCRPSIVSESQFQTIVIRHRSRKTALKLPNFPSHYSNLLYDFEFAGYPAHLVPQGLLTLDGVQAFIEWSSFCTNWNRFSSAILGALVHNLEVL